MTNTEIHRDAMELEQDRKMEGEVVKSDGVLLSVLRGLYWPFGIVVRAFWWILGFRKEQGDASVRVSPGRQNLAGRKRLSRVTRLLLSILPRRVQGALGYPVSGDIGRSLSPEIKVSPTKPSGKGSKRKQDELYEEEEEEEVERPSWVEAFSRELTDDDAPDEDVDYEPSAVETESEEYRSHNSTESDFEIQNNLVVIENVETGLETSTLSEVSPVAV